MNKGYYNEYKITSYADDDNVIHGQSYAIRASNVDFTTWKQNQNKTDEYWLKLHTISGKEIRIKVDYKGLNEILEAVGNPLVEYRNRDYNELEHKY
tara:strand:+ start:45 stop:332 length:288 start_codon:yes stop_codon:yes gene_type:complete